ncbi:MAG: ABC transporter permease [Desulfovibrionaceae bacterium]|nr:ABC transporter permease [Desulfovibrionaceae bacterium]
MPYFLLAVLALLRKELLMIVKDKRARIILIMPIVIQTVLFGFVATFDLNSADYALLDLDHTQASRELVHRFDGTGLFHRRRNLQSSQEIADILTTKEVLLVLHIASGFERSLQTGKKATVQILIDGRNSNVAGVAMGYAQTILADFHVKGQVHVQKTIVSRAWFNPNLETRWGILSALTAILSVIQVLSLAGQSIAREKEKGTFDQLLVTPLNSAMLLIGKAIPPVLVGLVQATLVLLVSIFGFHIPFAGSVALLYGSLTIYNFSVVGIGLCVSSLAQTMQQAMLYNFTLLMPMILLSGFATPIASMPKGFQIATYCNPVRYGVDFAQRIYLEGATFAQILPDLVALLLIAVVTLSSAAYLFRAAHT